MPPISVGGLLNSKTVSEVLTKILFFTHKVKRTLRTYSEFCLRSE